MLEDVNAQRAFILPTICNPDWSQAMREIARTIAVA